MKIEPNLNIAECIISYFIMMAVIVIGVFAGQYWFAALGFLFFLRGITGWCPLKTYLNEHKSA